MNTKLVFLLSSLLFGCWAQRKSYAGYEVIKTETVSESNLKTLYLHSGQWDFLNNPTLGLSALILVPPEESSEVKQTLNSDNIAFEVLEQDVQSVLDENRNEIQIQKGSVTFQRYMSLSEINDYLENIEKLYPQRVSVLNIGKSYEGRPIKLIKISSGGENKPGILVETTMHSREWLATCGAMYLINQLAENYTENSDLVDKLDWYIMPVVNVDGYEYTHTQDRCWRKTRSDVGHPSCKGVDGNRNFPFQWEEGGLFSGPCSLQYPGKFASSEFETQAVVNFSTTIKDRIKLYISVHAFGAVLLHSWGYTKTPPEDEADLQSLGKKVVAAVKNATGTEFLLGSIAKLMYRASGNSIDWAKVELGVKYSYAIEVNSGGYYTFEPPPSEILPSVTETFEIFKAFGQYFGSGGT